MYTLFVDLVTRSAFTVVGLIRRYINYYVIIITSHSDQRLFLKE